MASSSSLQQLFRTKGFPMVTSSVANPHAAVGKWLFATGGMVVGMITVGGMTRLTQSGLSMTTWSPLGSLPPITQDEWLKEFERYKTFPEWSQRKSMSLSEFKYIYGWEYGHRMLGRVIGICFTAPWIYFTVRGKIPKGFQSKMVGLFAMGGTQGLVGWWMVKSGLGGDRFGDKKEIRVRPFRLAAHMTMALATYGALVWTGFDIMGLQHKQKMSEIVQNALSKDGIRIAQRLRTGSLALSLLTAITVTSGALVAGNDAGRAYNTFPKMGDHWMPPFEEMMELSPWYRNLYETTPMVQFNHRVLGSTTAATALSLAAMGLGLASRKPNVVFLTPQARNGLYAIGASATAQVTLGITTLLYYVPFSLAVAHQIGSVVVFTSSLYLAHSLRYAAPKVLQRTVIATTSSTTSMSKAATTMATSAAKNVAPKVL